MVTGSYVPHIDLLLGSLRIPREKFFRRSKVTIDTKLLRVMLEALVVSVPFDPQFYLDHYPDVAAAHAAGDLPDLHRHFVEVGYFEGRIGAVPDVDEAFYASMYKDIQAAVRRGVISSPTDHYIRTGASEGRLPNAAMRPTVEHWASALHD